MLPFWFCIKSAHYTFTSFQKSKCPYSICFSFRRYFFFWRNSSFVSQKISYSSSRISDISVKKSSERETPFRPKLSQLRHGSPKSSSSPSSPTSPASPSCTVPRPSAPEPVERDAASPGERLQPVEAWEEEDLGGSLRALRCVGKGWGPRFLRISLKQGGMLQKWGFKVEWYGVVMMYGKVSWLKTSP